jgi:hypothetical protein
MILRSDGTIQVNLTASEIRQVAFVGANRRAENIIEGRRDKNGSKIGRKWQVHIDGVTGEMVLAKATGYFLRNSRSGLHDVGNYEVRFTSKSSGNLLLFPGDRDDVPYVYVTPVVDEDKTPMSFIIWGWVTKAEAINLGTYSERHLDGYDGGQWQVAKCDLNLMPSIPGWDRWPRRLEGPGGGTYTEEEAESVKAGEAQPAKRG